MFVIDEITRKKVAVFKTARIITYYSDDYVEYGYTTQYKNLPFITINNARYRTTCFKDMDLIFSKYDGLMHAKTDEFFNSPEYNVFGNGDFPYGIVREYEAEHHINKFQQGLKDITEIEFISGSNALKYSFGLEFETAAGYIPEEDCFNLGLIPLRDGSISGVEYSTIPLSGNEGLNRLKLMLNTLKENTVFNKDCSLHIHLGGFPVNRKTIFALYTLWTEKYQWALSNYIPAYSYRTEKFKSNGKSYCKVTTSFESFEDLYRGLAQTSYLGDLYQPHPYDVEKKAKWNIKTRYFNCNFINMLCYNCAKTVEFRFLTPTYSFEKIKTFLLLLNSLLLEAEELASKNLSDKKLFDSIANHSYICNAHYLIKKHYNKSLVEELTKNLSKLEWCRLSQNNAGDYCGARVDIEYKYFPDGQ